MPRISSLGFANTSDERPAITGEERTMLDLNRDTADESRCSHENAICKRQWQPATVLFMLAVATCVIMRAAQAIWNLIQNGM